MADSIEQLAERDIPPIKNDASAPVLMMLAFAKLPGGDRSLACVGVRVENGIYGHSRFCNTDFDDKLACLNLSGV
ncbi:hypothetical protein RNF79_005218 [Klebsiella pneumoniae]|nr:hypothetical protein [Klebsiella pneumoniae]